MEVSWVLSFITVLLLKIYYFYLYVCICVNASRCVQVAIGAKRGCWILWVWSYSQLWAAAVGQESNESSRRAACAPNCWHLSSLTLCFLTLDAIWPAASSSWAVISPTVNQSKPFLPSVLLPERFITDRKWGKPGQLQHCFTPKSHHFCLGVWKNSGRV